MVVVVIVHLVVDLIKHNKKKDFPLSLQKDKGILNQEIFLPY